VGKAAEKFVVELRATTTTMPSAMPGPDSVRDFPYPRDL
jgi:hypothetical protein